MPNAFAEVYVDNDHKYLGDDGTIHIVGEIINESDKPINQVNVIAVSQARTEPDYLRASD